MHRIIPAVTFFLISLTLYAQADSLKIVAFGNSTTAHRRGVEKVFSVRLQEKMDMAGIAAVVINSGVGSSHTGSVNDNDFAKVRHGMDRFQSDVLVHCPHWVIINFGLNDAYQDEGIHGKARISLIKYRDNIEFFIKKIKEQGGEVILLTPNPLGSKYEQFRITQVEQYANCVRAIAREQEVPLVDSWELFNEHASVTNVAGNIDFLYLDGIHPNDLGHELIAEALYSQFLRLLVPADNNCRNAANRQ
ncbi:MAG: hypothetical protein JJE08_10650 [Proteiniphilum sp.]|nr:hypothetical protein [Proteiniphilum sp.]